MYNYSIIAACLVYMVLAQVPHDNIPRVTLDRDGTIIEGFGFQLNDGRLTDIYLGIPFAEPPIGELRFRPPQRKRNLPANMRAKKFSNRCIQTVTPKSEAPPGLEEPPPNPVSEDCLYLNVMKPAWPSNSGSGNFPVLFWIHGGSFQSGSTDIYGYKGLANNLVSKDVIVVTTNYRLGPFGYAYLADSTLPANLGLRDLTAALHWVNENIGDFGGDISKVTIMGESAGSMNSLILALAPQSRGYFHNVIAMSGAISGAKFILDPNGFKAQRNTRELAQLVANQQGISVDSATSNEDLFDILQSADAEAIQAAFEQMKLDQFERTETKFDLQFTPVIDNDFLPAKYQEESILDRKNVIIGTMELEMSWIALALFPDGKPVTMQDFDDLFSSPSFFPTTSSPSTVRRRVAMLKDYYLNGTTNNRQDLLERLSQAMSDISMYRPTYKDVNAMLDLGWDVRLYSFDYANPAAYKGLDMVQRPGHAMELVYLFNRTLLAPFYFSEEDKVMRDVFSTIWANFVKYGNPTPSNAITGNDGSLRLNFDWPLSTHGNSTRYLSIKPRPQIKYWYHFDNLEFLNVIFIAETGRP